jgi:prephenate dehydrogenase
MGSVTEPPFRSIVVVGAGLIGTSIQLAARRAWPDVALVALDAGHDLASVRGADLVVLAAPVRANIELLDRVQPFLAAGAVVTDAGSTKRAICVAAASYPAIEFIGGHPMAGAARGGAVNARADLFEGRPWILTPRPGNPSGAVGRLEAFVTGLRAVPHVMTPDLHDRFVGAVSHLPQLTASALMHVVGKLAGDAGLELAGPGLVDTTRLASSPAGIWKDIAATNEDVLRDCLTELIRTLTDVRDSLATGEGVEAVFTSASRWRTALDRNR